MQEYANSKGVDIIGDMPIYVGGQSADVWANRDLFELGPTGAPEQVLHHVDECIVVLCLQIARTLSR